VTANELKENFRVTFGEFKIKGGIVTHNEPVLQAGIVEHKMIDGVIAKAKERGRVSKLTIKLDEIFVDESGSYCTVF
jgi:hypothetical protein